MTGASEFLTGPVSCFATHDGIPPASAPHGADSRRRYADQFGEATAEGANDSPARKVQEVLRPPVQAAGTGTSSASWHTASIVFDPGLTENEP
jgi:hypothetical protein